MSFLGRSCFPKVGGGGILGGFNVEFQAIFLDLALTCPAECACRSLKSIKTLPPLQLIGPGRPVRTGLDFKPTPYAAFGPIHSVIYRWQQRVHRQSGSEQSVCCGPSSHPTAGDPYNPRAAPYHRHQAVLITCVLLGLTIWR